MSKEITTDYEAQFKAELDKINKLEQTPKLIKDAAVDSLKSAAALPGLNHTTKTQLINKEKMLENISDSSINNNFKTIYAQMCVLAVSSLEALLKRYFTNLLKNTDNINRNNKRLKDLKISLSEILESNLKFGGKFGALVIEKANLNFQDLKSIKRNFSEYTNKTVKLDEGQSKKLCFYLEVRHVLVHRGGVIDNKFINAVTGFEANIKNYKVRDHVELDSNDWAEIKKSTTYLVKKLTEPPKVEKI